MPKKPRPEAEPTAADDVRRVREKIARQHGGNLAEHVRETNRIGEMMRKRLGVRPVSRSTRKRAS